MARPRGREPFRAAVGAGLALTLCGLLLTAINAAFGLEPAAGLFLIAPLGATAFLLFAVPNSPLAQPWSAIVGNGISAIVAVTVVFADLPAVHSAGLAVAFAIALMALCRAMHPPGAAVALATVLSEPVVVELGYWFALAPVLLDTALLVGFAAVYNRLTGRKYPFRQPAEGSGPQAAPRSDRQRLGLSPDDLADLLGRYNLSANIGAEDFGRVLGAATEEAARRQFNGLTCADVMSRDVVSVSPYTRLGTVADLFRRHHFKTVPVVYAGDELCGIITQNDLIQRAREDALAHRQGFAAAMSRLAGAAIRNRTCAADIMTTDLVTVGPDDRVGDLIRLLADGGVQAVPVVEHGRLVGIVTRSDLIAVLARQMVLNVGTAEAAAPT